MNNLYKSIDQNTTASSDLTALDDFLDEGENCISVESCDDFVSRNQCKAGVENTALAKTRSYHSLFDVAPYQSFFQSALGDSSGIHSTGEEAHSDDSKTNRKVFHLDIEKAAQSIFAASKASNEASRVTNMKTPSPKKQMICRRVHYVNIGNRTPDNYATKLFLDQYRAVVEQQQIAVQNAVKDYDVVFETYFVPVREGGHIESSDMILG